MELRPISLKAAYKVVSAWHRHHKPPQGARFALAAYQGDELVGVAIVGNPVARMLDDGLTAEITRVAHNGNKNAGSFLYSRAKRAAQALGFRRVVTYNLTEEESGASLRGAGYQPVLASSGGSWSRPSRVRVDKHPTTGKLRWQLDLERQTDGIDP